MQNFTSSRNVVRVIDALYTADYNNQGMMPRGSNIESRIGAAAEIGRGVET
jgi:hypothetical protein